MPAVPKSYSILLVEDSPADAMVVQESLSEYNVACSLTIVRDGEAAIRRIDELDAGTSPCPDLVILDLNLPKKSGHEVLERMRASARCGSVPIVVLSSSDAPDDKARAMALGSSRYLTKPPVFDDFLRLGEVFRDILAAGRR
jgi:CheY-like chemotaxis protein